MDLNIQIPDNTASIFEYLQKGLFISSNSTSEEVRDMYNEIDENYEPLYQYFSQINYTLERGNEYFFFSRIEPKATLEQKIMRAYYWIDVLDFFKTYDETSVPDSASSPNRYWWKPTLTCCSRTNWTVCGNTSRTRTSARKYWKT